MLLWATREKRSLNVIILSKGLVGPLPCYDLRSVYQSAVWYFFLFKALLWWNVGGEVIFEAGMCPSSWNSLRILKNIQATWKEKAEHSNMRVCAHVCLRVLVCIWINGIISSSGLESKGQRSHDHALSPSTFWWQGFCPSRKLERHETAYILIAWMWDDFWTPTSHIGPTLGQNISNLLPLGSPSWWLP